MELIRLVLAGGLVLHKLVWELYRAGKPQASAVPQDVSVRLKFFKLAKAIILLFLIVQTLFLNVLPIIDDPFPPRSIGLAMYLLGLAIAISGRVQLGKNWANLEDAQVLTRQTLVQEGIYRFIRHPIYVGDSLLLIGLELALNSWLVLAMLVPVGIFVRQAVTEEQLLAKSFDDYAAYRQQTKRFIPFVY
jgi:protein-S-isoprenylcysteine O-methyltransferase Ste14